MIVGLFSELLAAGGVQRAGRHTAAVAAMYAAAHGMPYRFLSLNDVRGEHTVQVGTTQFSFAGFAKNKVQFALAAMRAADSRARLILALHPNLAPIVAAMKFRSRASRSMIFAHGIEVWRPLGGLRGISLRRADWIVAPSEDTAHHVVADQRVDAEKVRALPWGLDPEFEARLATQSSPPRPAGFPAQGPVILTVGRWDPAERYKGVDTLISALPRVLPAVPGARLVAVGSGPDRARLERLAQDAGVAAQIVFLAGLTQAELFACYAHCDIFAMPSAGEGFGLVFLEAMAHAKPVIGGAHGGTPEVVADGASGLLVPHADVEKLSGALQTLLIDAPRAKEMGLCGRERVRAAYTFERFKGRLEDLLRKVLQE